MFACPCAVFAQEAKDSGNTPLSAKFADRQFLGEHFTGNIVHSMDIGAGFAKPVIRGLGFNRIAVAENGVKQEGTKSANFNYFTI
jgi:hypothetical protein